MKKVRQRRRGRIRIGPRAGMYLLRAILTMAVVLVSASTQAQTLVITRAGSRPLRQAPADNFTGGVRVEPLFEALEPSHASGASVTFERGARTAWHSHPRGQILIVTAGTGRVQRWGDPAEEIRSGDVVRIPAGEKHWHGASPHTSMTHIAITEHRDGTRVQWMEKVSDEQYNGVSGAVETKRRLVSSRRHRNNLLEEEAEYTDDESLDPRIAGLDGDAIVWHRTKASRGCCRSDDHHKGATRSYQSLEREMAVDVGAEQRRFVCSLP